jgi:hypothetical protein
LFDNKYFKPFSLESTPEEFNKFAHYQYIFSDEESNSPTVDLADDLNENGRSIKKKRNFNYHN